MAKLGRILNISIERITNGWLVRIHRERSKTGRIHRYYDPIRRGIGEYYCKDQAAVLMYLERRFNREKEA